MRRRWDRDPLDVDANAASRREPDADTWTATLMIPNLGNVPMEIEEVRDEQDCVDAVKAWLANLNEDGTRPTDWDGWLEVDYRENGAETRLAFRALEVKGFTVSPGGIRY